MAEPLVDVVDPQQVATTTATVRGAGLKSSMQSRPSRYVCVHASPYRQIARQGPLHFRAWLLVLICLQVLSVDILTATKEDACFKVQCLCQGMLKLDTCLHQTSVLSMK